jgi:hypothetical protein
VPTEAVGDEGSVARLWGLPSLWIRLPSSSLVLQLRSVPHHSRFICLGARWLFLEALCGLQLLLIPRPTWVLRILAGTWLISGGIL